LERWRRIGRTVEYCGFDELFRSDHFVDPEGPYADALELGVSLAWLADNTDRIEFGSLVTPLSFRDPVFTARMAKDVANLAGGRLNLGLGAGWQGREHEAFGYDLLEIPDRFDRFEEGLTVVERLLRRDDPVSFDGDYFELDEALLKPRPDRDGWPRLLVGGNGRNRTLPLAARFADEWNGVFLPPEEFEAMTDALDRAIEDAGRNPGDVRRSVMTGLCYGRDEDELDRELDGRDPKELREQGMIVGTDAEVADHIERLDEAGADRVMLQWLALDDLDRLEVMAEGTL
jgi:F420-dependent oxidoreductase-like protein